MLFSGGPFSTIQPRAQRHDWKRIPIWNVAFAQLVIKITVTVETVTCILLTLNIHHQNRLFNQGSSLDPYILYLSFLSLQVANLLLPTIFILIVSTLIPATFEHGWLRRAPTPNLPGGST